MDSELNKIVEHINTITTPTKLNSEELKNYSRELHRNRGKIEFIKQNSSLNQK